MLQIDPMKRATAEDIHKHEWFQKDLPTYLFPDSDINVAIMDHETIAVVCEVCKDYLTDIQIIITKIAIKFKKQVQKIYSQCSLLHFNNLLEIQS